MRNLILLFIVFFCSASYGPPNCNLYKGNGNCYEACLEAEKAIRHSQGSKASQDHFDKSIQLCPDFAYSYFEKSVPFAKRGLIKEWKLLIDKAVEIDPVEYLANRGWYHFFFLHNYESAISDIEELEQLTSGELGYTGDGVYHLSILKGIAYNRIGKKEQAISIMENLVQSENYQVGNYDYLHLGVACLDANKLEMAEDYFDKQKSVNDISEIYYYLGQIDKIQNKTEAFTVNMEKARDYYIRERTMFNPYNQMPDKIYLTNIENELGF